MVTAKMQCVRIVREGSYQQITLRPVYSAEPTSPNYSWSQATPSGQVELTITNPNAYAHFEVGQYYLITFNKTEE